MTDVRKYIVIVEEDEDTALQIEKLIRNVSRRCIITSVKSIVEGYQLVRKREVSLLIVGLEYRMSKRQDCAGIQLIHRIRKCSSYQFLPIIVIAPDDRFQEAAYLEWNCVGYFMKPIEKNAFERLIRKMMNYKEISDEENVFYVRKHNVRYNIKVKDLVYAESYERILHIHLSDGSEIELSQKPIRYILKEAKSKNLIRCARGVLVNKASIYKMNFTSHDITLWNDKKIKMGKEYERKLKEIRDEISMERHID